MPRPRQGKTREDSSAVQQGRGSLCSVRGGTHKSKEKALLCNGRGCMRKGLLALAASPCRGGEAKDKKTHNAGTGVRHQIMDCRTLALSLAGSFV